MVALELKYKAPKAHTMLEIVYVRWGRAAHIVFFFFAVLTNLLVSLSMLQGARGARQSLVGALNVKVLAARVAAVMLTRLAAVQAVSVQSTPSPA